MPRPNAVAILVGAPRTGKTTLTKKLIEASNKKVLIYDVNNEEAYDDYKRMPLKKLRGWKGGKWKVFTDDAEELIYQIYANVRNATIIFEDATSYINRDTAKYLRKILVSRRHMNLDIIFSFHSLNQVPPMIYEMSNYISLKKTNDTIQKVKGLNKLPNPDDVMKAFTKVHKSKDPFVTVTVKTNV
ncbi:MAG: ATP-binding protein [Bacteroidota bacterium]